MACFQFKRIAFILEGKGDVRAAPALVAKIGNYVGAQVVVSNPPIKSGEAKKLSRIGELERYLILAASRVDASEIVLLVDLDDGCPAQYAKDFNNRADAISAQLKKKVHICFCVREFECWFLAAIDILREALTEYAIAPDANFPQAENIRGAKEALRKACRSKVYRESRDQVLFAKAVDVATLIDRSRSFRKLVKAISGMSYENIQALKL